MEQNNLTDTDSNIIYKYYIILIHWINTLYKMIEFCSNEIKLDICFRIQNTSILFHLTNTIFYIYYTTLNFQDYIFEKFDVSIRKWTICLHARTHRYIRIILEIILIVLNIF